MAKKLSNIKERVLEITDLKEITKEIFFAKIGMTYGSFKGSAKNRPLNSDAIENILAKYPDISPEWLITGKEPKIRPEYSGQIEVDDSIDQVIKLQDKLIKTQEATINNQDAIIQDLSERLSKYEKPPLYIKGGIHYASLERPKKR